MYVTLFHLFFPTIFSLNTYPIFGFLTKLDSSTNYKNNYFVYLAQRMIFYPGQPILLFCQLTLQTPPVLALIPVFLSQLLLFLLQVVLVSFEWPTSLLFHAEDAVQPKLQSIISC